jgi:hypothetical protein
MEDIMSHCREIWPLAFILAMASGSSNADAPVDTNPATFFQAGSLADTLQAASHAREGNQNGAGTSPIQLSQWFNFFNCFNGVWRKC